jgi:hypothetical protein
MSGDWKFYVYEIIADGAVVYVGKGCGKRAKVSGKERGGNPVVVAHFRHPEWALSFERERIAQRLAEGCKLLNITHGAALPWYQRTDTKEMAREVLVWMAGRVGRWIAAGRVAELARIIKMPVHELVALHQKFGI